MNKKLSTIIFTLPLLTALSGCVIAVGNDGDNDKHYSKHHDIEFKNRKHLAELSVGMSFLDVQHKMGIADFNDAYEKAGEKVQVLFYRTQVLVKDGITAKDECTPLVFINGQLTSWGEQAYLQL